MPGPSARLNPLQLRKRMLVVESELQRAALERDLDALCDSARTLASRTAALASLAAAAVGLADALVRRKRSPPARAAGRGDWLRMTLDLLELLLPLWQAGRAPAPGSAPAAAGSPPGAAAPPPGAAPP